MSPWQTRTVPQRFRTSDAEQDHCHVVPKKPQEVPLSNDCHVKEAILTTCKNIHFNCTIDEMTAAFTLLENLLTITYFFDYPPSHQLKVHLVLKILDSWGYEGRNVLKRECFYVKKWPSRARTQYRYSKITKHHTIFHNEQNHQISIQ